LQSRRLHKENQPLEQLDRVIEEIMKLMLRSTEAVNKGKMSRGGPTIAAKKKKKKMQQQQQQQGRGARRQLQGRVRDPGGFQHWRRGTHEHEIMFFLVVEYDAEESLHLNKCTSTPTHIHTMEKGRGLDPPIFKI
jgi:hypothetical protein